MSSLTLGAAKELFEEYHIVKGTRKKSRQSYLSKVNQFVAYYGQDKKVSEISDYDITEFLNFMEKKYTWAGVTYNSSRIILNNYFRYLKVNIYISKNPEDWALFGSYFGRITGTLMTFFAVLFSLVSIYFTARISNQIQDNEFKFSKQQASQNG